MGSRTRVYESIFCFLSEIFSHKIDQWEELYSFGPHEGHQQVKKFGPFMLRQIAIIDSKNYVIAIHIFFVKLPITPSNKQ